MRPFKVIAYAGEIDQIAGWAGALPDGETGGDLFGFWTHSGMPVVQFVLGPGPGAQHYSNAFFQDTAYLQAIGERINAAHGLQYIGEWHSHHYLDLDRPSEGDVETVAEVFSRHDFSRFLLCIVNLREDQSRTTAAINAFILARNMPTPVRAKWVVLEGESPIARAVRSDPALGSLRAPTAMVWDVERTSLAAAAGTEDIPRRQSTSPLLRDPQWRHFFNELLRGCEREFGTTSLHELQDGSLMLSFDYEGSALSVTFPRLYPDKPPSFGTGTEQRSFHLPINDCSVAALLAEMARQARDAFRNTAGSDRPYAPPISGLPPNKREIDER